MMHSGRKQRTQSGQSLVEMALAMIFILWLLSGAVDFGIAFFSYVAIRDAAQEGALFGSVNPPLSSATHTALIQRVQQSSNRPVDLNDPAVTVEVGLNGDPDLHVDPTVCAGDTLTVTVQYNYPIMMAMTSLFTGPIIPLRASATSTVLTPDCP